MAETKEVEPEFKTAKANQGVYLMVTWHVDKYLDENQIADLLGVLQEHFDVVVGQAELGEETKAKHYHFALKSKGQKWGNKSTAELFSKFPGKHPNCKYPLAKEFPAVLKYCSKERTRTSGPWYYGVSAQEIRTGYSSKETKRSKASSSQDACTSLPGGDVATTAEYVAKKRWEEYAAAWKESTIAFLEKMRFRANLTEDQFQERMAFQMKMWEETKGSWKDFMPHP